MSYSAPYWPVFNVSANATREEICLNVLQNMIPYTLPFPGYLEFVIAFIALYYVAYAVSLVLFLQLRKKDIRLRRRDFPLILFSTFSIPVVLFTGPLRDATGRANWSCDAVLWFRLMCIPMGQIPINLRLLLDYAKHDLNSAVAAAKLKTMAQAGENEDTESAVAQVEPLHEESPKQGNPPDVEGAASPRKHISNPLRTASSLRLSEMGETKSTMEDVKSTTTANKYSAGDIRKKKWRTSMTWTGMLILVGIAPFLIIVAVMYAIYPYYGKNCYGCQLGVLEYVLINLGGWSLAPWFMKAYWEMKDVPDPLGSRHEIWLIIYFTLAFCLPAIFMLIIDPWTGITARGLFHWDWITFVGCSFIHFWMVSYPIYIHFTTRANKEMHQDVIRLITDEEGMKVFTMHLVNEFAVESIKFYQEVTLWKKGTVLSFGKKNALETKLNWAKLIYESYLKPSSILQLNIASRQQEKIDTFFQKPMVASDEYSHELDKVFDEAYKESIILMTGSWPRFLQSKLYKDYMGGVRNKTGNTQGGLEMVAIVPASPKLSSRG